MTDRVEEPEASRDEGEEIREVVEEAPIERVQLEEATVDPEARVESDVDYEVAEAIESAVVTFVDDVPETPPESKPASLDKDGEGSEPYDPRKRYSGVKMQQGEVASDDDWNKEPLPDRGSPEGEDLENTSDGSGRGSISSDRDLVSGSGEEMAADIPSETPSEGEISRVDSFVSKVGVAKDEVGEMRVSSLHQAEIDPLPPRVPSGDHTESHGNGAKLERYDPGEVETRTSPELRPMVPTDGFSESTGVDGSAPGDDPSTPDEMHEDHSEPTTVPRSQADETEEVNIPPVNPAARVMLTRALLNDAFFDQLVVDVDSALEEYGLSGDDLPDLSDPENPETISFVNEVENEVLEAVRGLDTSAFGDDLQRLDSDREIRMILLNQMINKKGSAVSQLTNAIKRAHNTEQSIINNLR